MLHLGSLRSLKRARARVPVRAAGAQAAGRSPLWSLVGLCGGLSLLVAAAPPAQEIATRLVVAVEAPALAAIRALASAPRVDVRWVERGLILCEVERLSDLPAGCGGQVVARRPEGQELVLLRRPELEHWRKAGTQAVLEFLDRDRVARVRGETGEVWVGVAAPGSWPAELAGCHTGLVLAGHRLNPESLIDAGPPPTLRSWLQVPPRALTAGEARVLAAVSPDSLARTLLLLSQDPSALPADRYVFHSDLDEIYSPRIEASMLRLVEGIPNATVRRDSFAMRSLIRTHGGVRDTTFQRTYNVVAHVPGSVPGFGTFVLGAHIDATGQRDTTWARIVGHDTTFTAAVQTPGVEDNATGVACVLELLRGVADGVRTGDLDFAFALDFVAFSGEEVPVSGGEPGLVGSGRYVQHRLAEGTPLLGAFNLDMVGYDTPEGSAPSVLHLVYNVASRWLVDEVLLPGAAMLSPQPAFTLVRDLDESRASDHNSFWSVNAPAMMAADAGIDVLRSYATYHKPVDLQDYYDPDGQKWYHVRAAKLADVVRVLLAGLSRFDTRAHAEPRLLLAPEDLKLLLTVQGRDVVYDPSFHRLWPGSPLKARLYAHSLGAGYAGPVRIELATRRGSDPAHVFLDSTAVRSLPTGARIELLGAIPIEPRDAGLHVLEARLTYTAAGGAPAVQTTSDSFFVQGQGPLRAAVLPNPVRDPSAARVSLRLDRPGEVRIDVYDLEGEHVASSRRRVVPRVTTANFDVPLFEGEVPHGLASGIYLVRVRWIGAGGESATSTARLVVLK